MRDYEGLASKVKWSTLSDEEIADVVQRIKEIKQGADDENLSTLIYILGRAGLTKYREEYRELVEPFLYYPADPDVSKEALHTLCMFWSLTSNYLNELKQFIKGVEWDDDDIRLFAISFAGEFLNEAFDKDLLQLLIDIFEDFERIKDFSISEEKAVFIKGCAYDALARAVGKEHWEIPDSEQIETWIENKQFDRLDLTILQKAHQLVQQG